MSLRTSGSASRKFLIARMSSRYLRCPFVPSCALARPLLQERHRIDVDCRRTDRTQPLFANQTSSDTPHDPEKQQHQHYSTISPTPIEVGAQSPSNEHIDRLGSILLTYNFYEKDLGAPSFSYTLGGRVSTDM
jgi:hypothetical protein